MTDLNRFLKSCWYEVLSKRCRACSMYFRNNVYKAWIYLLAINSALCIDIFVFITNKLVVIQNITEIHVNSLFSVICLLNVLDFLDTQKPFSCTKYYFTLQGYLDKKLPPSYSKVHAFLGTVLSVFAHRTIFWDTTQYCHHFNSL